MIEALEKAPGVRRWLWFVVGCIGVCYLAYVLVPHLVH